MSATGKYQAATSGIGVYTSSDFGVTWSLNSNLGTRNLNASAISSSGMIMVVGSPSYIGISYDYGTSWKSVTLSGSFYGLSMSALVQYITAQAFNGHVYISTNYGNTWTTTTLSSGPYVVGNSMSSSGQWQLVNGTVGNLYISSSYPTPNLPLTTDNTLGKVVYNSTNNLSYYSTSKTFVIPHPLDNNKYLVHACLEGPEAGVYYRGEAEIVNNEYVEIGLPEYVDLLAYEFTVDVSSLTRNVFYTASYVENNKFTVYGPNGSFCWMVYGKRDEVNVELNVNDVVVKGNGPYKWI